MRRQHRKDGYQFRSLLSLGNTGLVVAVAGILAVLFLITNILPLVTEPENREYCEMVKILYDLDGRRRFTRPAVGEPGETGATLSWTPYRSVSEYAHDNVLIPTPGDTSPSATASPVKGLVYETNGVQVSVRHSHYTIKSTVTDLLNPGSLQQVAQKPLFAFLRESLGVDHEEFQCKAINTPETVAQLISSVISTDGADSIEVYDLAAMDALLLKRHYADSIRLELLFQDLDKPDQGLINVQIDGAPDRTRKIAASLTARRLRQ